MRHTLKKDKIRLYLGGYISSEGENRFQSFPVPTERDVGSTAERLRKWIQGTQNPTKTLIKLNAVDPTLITMN